MNDNTINTIVNGFSDNYTAQTKEQLEQSIREVSKSLDTAKQNRTTTQLLGQNPNQNKTSTYNSQATDSQLFTSISEMINGSDKDPAGFGTMLESLYQKNKKYYSIIKDYEIMPILIPQINRVLMFLVNECISPDIQNESTFTIKYLPDNDPDDVQGDIEDIKKEMKLDPMLREVYMNRYKLGHEYYLVVDYNRTFDHMLEMIKQKGLNEATAQMSDIAFLESQYQSLRETINDFSATVRCQTLVENVSSRGNREGESVTETEINLDFSKMNIVIERSPVADLVEDAHATLLSEAYSRYKMSSIMGEMMATGTLNEAVVDTSKLASLVDNMRKKKLQRCMIERLDPAKVFHLKIGGKIIGYFVITDLSDNAINTVNFAQALKDQLLKARATNLNTSSKVAEEVISKELAERIITTFDSNLGINRIEDIDLLHDYIRNNEVYKGNKKITFYYQDEIFDMSRADDSILTNAVFFTKLYATLLLNNIMTKVLRGRGRQIHTVHLGASPNVQRYIQNAMACLTMPENNLGTLHGSFEQIMNPFNSASDIIIPTEEDTARYIETDYIPGQDVNMDDDFLRMLLNSIISSFGLDSAVIDTTNGNLQFARTLTMESLQICTAIRNEQQDLHDNWENMCLEVLRIMGKDATQKAVTDGKIKVSFFEPKSLILQNTIDEINNAKSFAENIADLRPEFNAEDSELKRSKFILSMVKDKTNMDWEVIEKLIEEGSIDSIGDDLEAKIQEIVRQYIENTKQQEYGDSNGDGITAPDDGESLSPEEESLLNDEDY